MADQHRYGWTSGQGQSADPTRGRGERAGASGTTPNPASSSSSPSTSSFMSKFYTPMNPSAFVASSDPPASTVSNPAPAPQQQQVTPAWQSYPQFQDSPGTHYASAFRGSSAGHISASQTQSPVALDSGGSRPGMTASTSLSQAGSSLGAGAALVLANLTALPGFLSDQAIQEARQEYEAKTRHQQPPQSVQPQQHPSHLAQAEQGYPGMHPGWHADNQAPHLPESSVYPSSGAMPSFPPTQEHWKDPSVQHSSLQMVNPSPPLTPPQPLPESQPQTGNTSTLKHEPKAAEAAPTREEYSGKGGRITPLLLKRLAELVERDTEEGGPLLSEIRRLRQRQHDTERSLFEERKALMEQHKKDLVQLQASEILGTDVSSSMRETKKRHRQELGQLDKRVLGQIDHEIMIVQQSLERTMIPTMTCTTDPAQISVQIKILRILEDMLLQT